MHNVSYGAFNLLVKTNFFLVRSVYLIEIGVIIASYMNEN